VHEALQRLAQEGLVVVIPHKGATVANLTAADVEEIHLMRARLEGLAAHMAAQRLTPQDAKALRAVIEDLEAKTAAGDTEEIRRVNVRVHQAVWQASHSSRLQQVLINLQDYVEMSRSVLLSEPRGADVLLEEHSAIVRAVLDRHPEHAEEAIPRHIDHTLDVLRSKSPSA
jgi:DNA-binding GntR family transcriptional regulator